MALSPSQAAVSSLSREQAPHTGNTLDPEQLYHMGFHDILTINPSVTDKSGTSPSIIRVPGGWIYFFFGCSEFVPYNEEFHVSI